MKSIYSVPCVPREKLRRALRGPHAKHGQGPDASRTRPLTPYPGLPACPAT